MSQPTNQQQQSECTPTCPWCNTAKSVRTSGTSFRAHYCGRCGREFEAENDGDIGRGRPDKIAERREEYAIRERIRQRKARQGQGQGGRR